MDFFAMRSPGERLKPPLLPIALVGTSTLLFEVLLTRIFSVTMWYHFAFIAISLALFGIALSGVFLTIFRHLARQEPFYILGICTLLFAITIPFSFISDLHIPFLPLGAHVFAVEPYLLFFLKFLVLSIPFFCSGLTIALSFSYFPGEINKLYFADLFGAGLGCALAVPVLTCLSAPSAVIFVSALLFLAGTLIFLRCNSKTLALACGAGVLGVVILVSLNEQTRIISITKVKSYNPSKGQEVERPKIYEQWNPVSRVAAHPLPLSGSPQSWFYSRQTPVDFPEVIEVTNDGGARTFIYPRMPVQQAQTLFEYDASDIVYSMTTSPSVLVIGVGGGKDILAALAFRSRKVTGVELNPLMVDLVQNYFAGFSGRPYNDPRVRMVIDEGRNFVASQSERYDVIKMSVTDTWAASMVGSYALVENYLYTREAIQDFLKSLNPQGYLTITRWYPQESLRMTVLVTDVLNSNGINNAQGRLALIRNNSTTTIIIKNLPFELAETARLSKALDKTGHTLIYAPGLSQQFSDAPIDKLHRQILAEGWEKIAQSASLNLSPPIDDRPFFFNLVSFGTAMRGEYGSAGGFVLQHGRALFLLIGMFIVSMTIVILFLIAPLVLFKKHFATDLSRRRRFGINCYFLAVGFGYILIEIPLIQRLILFLGHPVYAFTVALFSLLAFSGIGSISVKRLPFRSERSEVLLIFLAFALTAIAGRLVPELLKSEIGLPIAARLVVATLVVAPIGFLLGIPFPAGLSSLHKIAPDMLSWAWAVNGAASVTAPVISMIVAITLGFTVTHYLGAGCYAAASLLFFIYLTKPQKL